MAKDLTEIFDALNRRLAVLIQLTAYQLVKGQTLAEAAPILRRLGLAPSEIAAVFDTTAKTVSVRVSEAKRKRSKKNSYAG
jgi:DNA-directed RNA polymerase specialized sigma24 family protein